MTNRIDHNLKKTLLFNNNMSEIDKIIADAKFTSILPVSVKPAGDSALKLEQLIAARDAGAAVLLISDDLDEVLTLGNRVAVMHGGHLSQARAALEWSRESVGLAMAGAEGAAHAT